MVIKAENVQNVHICITIMKIRESRHKNILCPEIIFESYINIPNYYIQLKLKLKSNMSNE